MVLGRYHMGVSLTYHPVVARALITKTPTKRTPTLQTQPSIKGTRTSGFSLEQWDELSGYSSGSVLRDFGLHVCSLRVAA